MLISESTPDGLGAYFAIQSNVTAFTCLNLADVFSNQDTTSGNTTDGSPVFILDGVKYTRPADYNGGNSSGANFNASADYNNWHVGQGFRGLDTDMEEPNSGIPAPMQLNIYGEAECHNRTHPFVAYSCQNAFPVPGGAGWGAKSVSLQPNNVNAGGCLYNATNGVESSGAVRLGGAGAGSQMTWLLSVFVVALAAGV